MSDERLYPLKLYIKYRVSWAMIGLALLLNLLTWLWVAWRIRPQTWPIFLHYNVLFGVDYVGEWWRVFAVPATGSVILLANFFLGWMLFGKDKFISLLINSVSVICNALLLVTAGILIFLNI